MDIIAGHIGTSTISGDPGFHGIFYDGKSHYYIDGSVGVSGFIPILMVDTETGKYYEITGAPEDIDMQHQFLRLRVQRIGGDV
jgi:serine/threonine protein phosphatase 1